MPPVAAAPIMQPNGQTARNATMRPLQPAGNRRFPPMTAYLPVVRREGSRPLLAALRQRQPIGQPALHRNFIAVSPPASPSYKCARTARTPYLLFLIYYLLSIICPSGALSPPMVHPALLFNNAQNKKQPYVFRKAVLWCTIGDSNPGPTD